MTPDLWALAVLVVWLILLLAAYRQGRRRQ